MANNSIINQVRTATKSPIAAVTAALLGGFVPVVTYMVAHHELKQLLSIATLLVLGGLVYSAKTVWQWGRLAFSCPYKATGFVLLVEGVMTLSKTEWLGLVALCYLVAINAIATACLLARSEEKATAAKNNKRAKAEPVSKVRALKSA